MSFSVFKETIEENDTVILYIGFNNIYAIEVTPHIVNKHGQKIENVFQTQYGALKVMSLVGKKYGCKVNFTKGWGIALYPTPELWTVTLPHRTQILYATDIAMITGCLNITNGSVVCEAGTGSGSLSHSLLRALGEGRLYTADFHQERVEKAREEFAKHGLSSRVSIEQRDVYRDGWQVAGEADAVFMDLPKPWLALHHAVNAVKEGGGRICSFSPCIEQVSRTSELMRRLGLQNVKTIEVLLRELQVKTIQLSEINLEEEVEANSINGDVHASKKRKLEDSPEESQSDLSHVTEDNNQSSSVPEEMVVDSTNSNGHNSQKDVRKNSTKSTCKSMLAAFPLAKQAGHTGYLTFCFVPPDMPRPAPFIQIVPETES